MGFWDDVGDNATAFFGGSTPEKVKANRDRVNAFKSANKPLPSIQHDLGNNQALAIPGYKANIQDYKPMTPANQPVYNAPDSSNPRNYHQDQVGNADGDNLVDNRPQPSLLDQLMQEMRSPYKRPDASQFDFSPIDNALKGRIDLIEKLKGQAQGNFTKSDANIQAMHNQFQNQVQTEDAGRYNAIADQQKANLAADSGAGIAALQASKDKDMAARTDMLNKLGIQAAGGAVDPGQETLSRGISTIGQRQNADQTMADQQRANNLSYNNTVAQSIGSAGVQRRTALQQQLQSLMGKADLSENEAQTQAAQQKASMLNDAQGVSFNAWKSGQDRAQNLFDTLIRNKTQQDRYQLQYGNKNNGGGYGQVADDLAASGVDPNDAATGMAALDDILSSGNYLEGANGPNGTTPYDRSNVLATKLREKGVNPQVAARIATNVGKSATLR